MKTKILLLLAAVFAIVACKKQDGATDPSVKGYTVTTFAGSGVSGFLNGTGTAIQFNRPVDISIDASGNLYVADVYNEQIRKITPGGVISTLSGNGIYGYVDGLGAAAQFKDPMGLTADAGGNVYVADYTNQRIRKITAAGNTSTYAGDGSLGYAEGTGITARFNYMADVAVDSAGNVYVADEYNHRIRKINPAGVTSTVAGSSTPGTADGKGAAAQFNFPYSIVFDNGSGNMYIADYQNHNIRKISSAGEVSTLAGGISAGYADGTGNATLFNQPKGLALDASGNLFVADYGNNRIRKVTPQGVVTTVAGSSTAGYADGAAATAQFNGPTGVAVDKAGNIYVADFNNFRIRKIVYQ